MITLLASTTKRLMFFKWLQEGEEFLQRDDRYTIYVMIMEDKEDETDI